MNRRDPEPCGEPIASELRPCRLGSESGMWVFGGPALERVDLGVLHDPGADLDRHPDGPIPVPRRGAVHHRAQVGDQSLADAPGRAVPQIGRAVIHAVVGDTVAIGSSKLVGRAQANPMPKSQDTSTIRLPGANSASSASETNISGASVS